MASCLASDPLELLPLDFNVPEPPNEPFGYHLTDVGWFTWRGFDVEYTFFEDGHGQVTAWYPSMMGSEPVIKYHFKTGRTPDRDPNDNASHDELWLLSVKLLQRLREFSQRLRTMFLVWEHYHDSEMMYRARRRPNVVYVDTICVNDQQDFHSALQIRLDQVFLTASHIISVSANHHGKDIGMLETFPNAVSAMTSLDSLIHGFQVDLWRMLPPRSRHRQAILTPQRIWKRTFKRIVAEANWPLPTAPAPATAVAPQQSRLQPTATIFLPTQVVQRGTIAPVDTTLPGPFSVTSTSLNPSTSMSNTASSAAETTTPRGPAAGQGRRNSTRTRRGRASRGSSGSDQTVRPAPSRGDLPARIHETGARTDRLPQVQLALPSSSSSSSSLPPDTEPMNNVPAAFEDLREGSESDVWDPWYKGEYRASWEEGYEEPKQTEPEAEPEVREEVVPLPLGRYHIEQFALPPRGGWKTRQPWNDNQVGLWDNRMIHRRNPVVQQMFLAEIRDPVHNYKTFFPATPQHSGGIIYTFADREVTLWWHDSDYRRSPHQQREQQPRPGYHTSTFTRWLQRLHRPSTAFQPASVEEVLDETFSENDNHDNLPCDSQDLMIEVHRTLRDDVRRVLFMIPSDHSNSTHSDAVVIPAAMQYTAEQQAEIEANANTLWDLVKDLSG